MTLLQGLSPAMQFGVIGLLIGVTACGLLLWIARRFETERKTADAVTTARMLRVMAWTDLIVIPAMMYYFGASQGG
jgi:hypothetical protein